MDEAIKILEQEVAWHQKNTGKAIGMSEDWIDGFIKGCEHCYGVLVICEDAVLTPAAPDSENDAPCCDNPGKEKCDQCQEVGLARCW